MSMAISIHATSGNEAQQDNDVIDMSEDLFFSLLHAGRSARRRGQHQVKSDSLGRMKLSHTDVVEAGNRSPSQGSSVTRQRRPPQSDITNATRPHGSVATTAQDYIIDIPQLSRLENVTRTDNRRQHLLSAYTHGASGICEEEGVVKCQHWIVRACAFARSLTNRMIVA